VALLHRLPPWRTSGPSAGEITARPLPDGVWRLDWLLPPGKDLVTPELLLARVRETPAAWTAGTAPPYEPLDPPAHAVPHRHPRPAAGPGPGDPGRLDRRHDPALRAAGHRRPHRPPPARPTLAGRPRVPRRGRGPPPGRAGDPRGGRGAAGRRQPRLETGAG